MAGDGGANGGPCGDKPVKEERGCALRRTEELLPHIPCVDRWQSLLRDGQRDFTHPHSPVCSASALGSRGQSLLIVAQRQ